jgi:hypothetical protein
MKRTIIFLLAGVMLALLFCQSLEAIPAFARKHGFNCNMCHVAFPKLNDFGQRFRDNGYQIPGQAGREKTVFETSIPIALRTSAGHTLYKSEGNTTAGFHLYGLDLLAAGVLHKNISFFFVYTPRLDEPAADYLGPNNGSNPSQPGALESANVVFSNLVPDMLNLRIGRFEPAYQLLSSRRLYYVAQPFEIYNYQTGSFDFSANPIGIEASGRFLGGLKYNFGLVSGTGGNPDNNVRKDLYLVLAKTFGQGEGQSAGQRIGLFGYLGWQPTDFSNTIIGPTGDVNGRNNKSFYRLGGSLSLNWKTFNLQALLFHGQDKFRYNGINILAEDYSFWGGVGQLDWAGLANNRLVGSLLYNWVRPPANGWKVDAFSALLRYYLGSWSAVNIAMHAEYTHRRFGAEEKIADDIFTLLLDFDF